MDTLQMAREVIGKIVILVWKVPKGPVDPRRGNLGSQATPYTDTEGVYRGWAIRIDRREYRPLRSHRRVKEISRSCSALGVEGFSDGIGVEVHLREEVKGYPSGVEESSDRLMGGRIVEYLMEDRACDSGDVTIVQTEYNDYYYIHIINIHYSQPL